MAMFTHTVSFLDYKGSARHCLDKNQLSHFAYVTINIGTHDLNYSDLGQVLVFV